MLLSQSSSEVCHKNKYGYSRKVICDANFLIKPISNRNFIGMVMQIRRRGDLTDNEEINGNFIFYKKD